MRCLLICALLLMTLTASHGSPVSKTQLLKRLLQKKGPNLHHVLEMKRKATAKRQGYDECYWYCDDDYKCLQEDDFCDGTATCDDGTDEHEELCNLESKRNLKLSLKNLMTKATAKREGYDECYWYCDDDYKCLQEDDFCDGTATCDDGTDEHEELCNLKRKRNLKLSLKNFMRKATAKRQGDDACYWYCDDDYKCLQEDDFCDGTVTCDDGTDEHPYFCEDEKRSMSAKKRTLVQKLLRKILAKKK